MASTSRRAVRRSRCRTSVARPSGSIHPRVQKVGADHFGIVAVNDHNYTRNLICENLDDERLARLCSIRSLECHVAALLVQTPCPVLLSFPGINAVSCAELAGEMEPIENTPSDNAMTGRAGLYPARHPSDQVDHTRPLAARANRTLRDVLLLIAENLVGCHAYFHGLAQAWQAAGVDRRVIVVRVATRFCRIACRMVAGRQVYRHPSCQKRHYILNKLSDFYLVHEMPMDRMVRGLHAAVDWIPPSEYAAEARPLAAGPGAAPSSGPSAARPRTSSGRCTGPRSLSTILPEFLVRLGVTVVESSLKGETDRT